MPSAVAFLPLSMSEFVNLATSLSLNFGSGMIFRLGTSRRRRMGSSSSGGSSLGTLDAVLRALAVAGGLVGGARPRGAGRVEGTADHVVAHAREVLDAAPADEDHGVLLEVVPLAGDVARHLHAVGEPHAAHLAERRVGLLRRGRVDTNADAAPLRARLEGGGRRLVTGGLAALTDELADGRHRGTKPPVRMGPRRILGESRLSRLETQWSKAPPPTPLPRSAP